MQTQLLGDAFGAHSGLIVHSAGPVGSGPQQAF
jgi:hypothetical protein